MLDEFCVHPRRRQLRRQEDERILKKCLPGGDLNKGEKIMGACFNSVQFDGNLTEEQLRKQFSAYKNDQEYEHGHDAYTGTLATTSGLKVCNTVFQNEREADDYIEKNTNKWENALAVRFKVVKVITKKEPTFNGKKHAETNSAIFGQNALCVRTINYGNVVLPDQLSDTQKERVKKLFDAYSEASKSEKSLMQNFRTLVHKLQVLDNEFNSEDLKSLKKIRSDLKKAVALSKKCLTKFLEIDGKIGSRLYKQENKEDGVQWLIGGWCAE
jgi:hypothetical protein